MAAPWDRDQIEGRIRTRLDELGLRPGTVARLLKKKSLLEKAPQYGRRLDQLEKIAAALNWTLPELLGIQAAPELDPVILCEALRIAGGLMAKNGDCPLTSSPKELAHVTANAYRILRGVGQLGVAFPLSEEQLQMFAVELRNVLPSADSSKS